MPTSYWLRRFLIVLVGAFGVLCLAHRLRGHGWDDALLHGAVWGAISAAVYTAAQIYHARRGRHCALCNDLPTTAAGRSKADA